MNKLLLVIDVQKNFINDHTKFLISKIDHLLKEKKFNQIAFTKFINDEHSVFYQELNYKGCILDSDREIVLNTKEYPVFLKRTYTAFTDELKEYIKNNEIDIIYLCGIDTDACVMKTALDLFEQNIKVKVLKEYSMSHSGPDYQKMGIKILEKLIGKNNVI